MNDEKAKVIWIEEKSPKQGKQGRCSSIYKGKRSGAEAVSGTIRSEAENLAENLTETFGATNAVRSGERRSQFRSQFRSVTEDWPTVSRSAAQRIWN